MSDSSQSQNQNQPKPRIIIELSPNGGLVMEFYRNGQRGRLDLNRGTEYWEILDELQRQKKAIEQRLSEKEEKQNRMENNRHIRVWHTTAQNHGTTFANRTVGSKKFGQYLIDENEEKRLNKERKEKEKTEKQKTNYETFSSTFDLMEDL